MLESPEPALAWGQGRVCDSTSRSALLQTWPSTASRHDVHLTTQPAETCALHLHSSPAAGAEPITDPRIVHHQLELTEPWSAEQV